MSSGSVPLSGFLNESDPNLLFLIQQLAYLADNTRVCGVFFGEHFFQFEQLDAIQRAHCDLAESIRSCNGQGHMERRFADDIDPREFD